MENFTKNFDLQIEIFVPQQINNFLNLMQNFDKILPVYKVTIEEDPLQTIRLKG